MKNILNKISAIILIFLLVISLGSCHGTKEEATVKKMTDNAVEFTVPENFDTTKEYNLTFWCKNDTNLVQRAVYEKAVEDFEKLYPNIHIEARHFTNYEDIYREVITNIATKTTPNICITYPDHVATYLSGEDVIVSLNNLMTDDKYGFGGSELLYDGPTSDEMISKYVEECTYNDITVCMPFIRSTEACYINKTYVEKLGYEVPDVLTWDFIWEVSNKAIEQKGEDEVLIPFIYKSTDNLAIQYLKQAGAGYTDDDGNVYMFNDTYIELLKKLAEEDAKGTFKTFTQVSYPGNYLNQGQCIFAIDSTAGATWMGADAPSQEIAEELRVQNEIVVRMIPQLDVENPVMISQGPSLCIFNKEDEGEVLASWLFLQYLLTDEVQIEYTKTEGYVPVTSKARNNASYQDYLSRSGEDNDTYYSVKIDATKLLLANDNNTFITPVFNGSTSVRSAAGACIERVVLDVKNKTLNDAYFESLFDTIKNQKKLDQIETSSSQTKDLGVLPTASIILICILVVVWSIIITYYLIDKKKHASDARRKN